MGYLLDLKEKISAELFDEVLIGIKEVITEYKFLGIKQDKWYLLAGNVAEYLINKNNNLDCIKVYMIKWAKKYIKGEYQARRGIIFNNLFVILKNKKLNIRGIILKFISIIKQNDVIFDKDFYDFLKEQVPEFNKILKQLEILDYSFDKFRVYYLNRYEFYNEFIGFGHSFGWTAKKVDEFVFKGFIDFEESHQSQIFIIKNYEIIEIIYKEFCKSIKEITFDDFILRIIALDYKKLEDMIREYKETFILKGLYDISLFVRLNNLISKIDLSSIKQAITKKNKSIIIKKTIYDYFPNIDGVSKEEKIKKVDEILARLSEEQRQNIEDYVNKKLTPGSKVYKNTASIISGLKKSYIQSLGLVSSELKKSTIYDYFPNIDGVSKEEKVKKVDEILARLSEEQRQNIEDYVNKKLTPGSKIYKNTASIISRLKKSYIQSLGLVSSELKKSTIYDYFPNIDGVSKEGKIKKVDAVLARLSEEQRQNIDAYVNKKLIPGSIEYKKAVALITYLKKIYLKYIETGILLKEKKFKKSSIYDYFPNVEGVSKEEKIKKVDEILARLSEAQRQNIEDYVNKRLTYGSREYINASNKLSRLKKLYIRYIKTGILPKFPNSKKTIYDYIPDTPNIDSNQKKEIVEALMMVLNSKHKDEIINYLNGKCKYSTAAFSMIKGRYLRYLESKKFILNTRLNNYQNFYGFIKILSISYETKFNIKLEPFIFAFKTLECNFRSLGFMKEDYQNWILESSLKIDPNLSFKEFLKSVLSLAYYEIKYYQENEKRGR